MGNFLPGSPAPNLSSIRDTTPEYLAFQKYYENVIGTVKEQPGAICDALFAKGYVPTSVRDFTRNMSILDEVKAQKLVDTMIDRIGKDPNVFHGFVDILKGPSTDDIVTLLQKAYDTECGLVGDLEPVHLASQQAKSSEDNDSSGDESFHSTAAEPKSSFICPFCKECTFKRFYFEEGCPHRTRSIEGYSKLFPYMDVKGLEEDDVIDLQQRLISDTKDIFTKFADFSIFIRKSLERQNVPLEQIKDSILSLEAFRENNGVKVLDAENQGKLFGASSVSEVFSILRISNYLSFFNYHLLEHLVKHHGCSDDHRLLEEYQRDLHAFCQRNIFQIPPLVYSSGYIVPPKAKLFALKCTTGVETLAGVQALQNEVAKVFDLRFSALRLCSIKKGCVELHFMVSGAVAERIFPVSHEQHLTLSEIGVRLLVSCMCSVKLMFNILSQQYRRYQISHVWKGRSQKYHLWVADRSQKYHLWVADRR